MSNQDWLEFVNNTDADLNEDDWENHREFEKLRNKKYEDAENLKEYTKIRLAKNKFKALDPRLPNNPKAITVRSLKHTYDKFNDDTMSSKTARKYLNRLSDSYKFIKKKDIPPPIRKSITVGDNTQYCYEYITLRERAQKKAKERQRRKNMAEFIDTTS